ncbi:MAG: thioredoxin domain-containing protein [SAR324 cluster bacterium]|nr:thioredoxin domain-containing protein [SAR324 cluster bacterium]
MRDKDYTMTMRIFLVFLLVTFPLWAAYQVHAQPLKTEEEEQEPLEDGELVERLEILESEYLQLKNEVTILRERLGALLGPQGDERIHDIAVGDSPVRGNVESPLTLIEFGDFQSEYAARASHVIRRLLEEYPDRLHFVFKHFPITSIHPEAHEAALASLAAEKQERAWEMFDLLFKSTRRLEPNIYLLLAQQLNLDLSSFDRDRRSLWALERMDMDEKTAVKAGVTAVPTFFLNGRRMKSWRYDFLKSQIDQLLLDAKPGETAADFADGAMPRGTPQDARQ